MDHLIPDCPSKIAPQGRSQAEGMVNTSLCPSKRGKPSAAGAVPDRGSDKHQSTSLKRDPPAPQGWSATEGRVNTSLYPSKRDQTCPAGAVPGRRLGNYQPISLKFMVRGSAPRCSAAPEDHENEGCRLALSPRISQVAVATWPEDRSDSLIFRPIGLPYENPDQNDRKFIDF